MRGISNHAFRWNLIRIREAKGWSKAELARRSGLTEACIGLLEKGKREPGIKTLTALSLATGTPVEQLLGSLKEEFEKARSEMRNKKNENAVKRLRVLLGGGRMRCRAIAEQLNAEGFRTARGTKWSYATVKEYSKRHPELNTEKPEPPEPTPPAETMPLPAAAEVMKLDAPFIRHILDSRELTDAKKVAMLRILI